VKQPGFAKTLDEVPGEILNLSLASHVRKKNMKTNPSTGLKKPVNGHTAKRNNWDHYRIVLFLLKHPCFRKH